MPSCGVVDLASRVGTRRTVVFGETIPWGGFEQLAAALRRHGVRVELLACPPVRRRGALRRAPRRLLFNAVHTVLRWDGGAAPVDVRAAVPLLGPHVAAVEAADEVAAALQSAGVTDRGPQLRRIGPGQDEGLLYDKLAMTRFAERLGLVVPRTWDRLEDAPDGPLVVKRRLGAGGQGVRSVASWAEAAAARQELAPDPSEVFAQELFTGPVAHVAGVARAGEALQAAAYRSEAALGDRLGPPAVVTVIDEPALLAAAGTLLAALAFNGTFCLDFVQDEKTGAWALIDVNSRIWGSWTALQRAGLDVVGAYLQVLGVARPEPIAARARPGAVFSGNPSRPTGRVGFVAAGRELRDVARLLGPRWALFALVERSLEVPGRVLNR